MILSAATVDAPEPVLMTAMTGTAGATTRTIKEIRS